MSEYNVRPITFSKNNFNKEAGVSRTIHKYFPRNHNSSNSSIIHKIRIFCRVQNVRLVFVGKLHAAWAAGAAGDGTDSESSDWHVEWRSYCIRGHCYASLVAQMGRALVWGELMFSHWFQVQSRTFWCCGTANRPVPLRLTIFRARTAFITSIPKLENFQNLTSPLH